MKNRSKKVITQPEKTLQNEKKYSKSNRFRVLHA